MEVTALANLKNMVKLKVNIETSEIDETTNKAARLVELLKEAKSLADDLASSSLEISLLIKSDI
jgi:hypothetical protein